MSYEEFFSRECVYSHKPRPEPLSPEEDFVFFVDKETSYLCNRYGEDWEEKIIVIDQSVGEFGNFCFAGNTLVAIVNGKKIIETDFDGKNINVIYEDRAAEGLIFDITANEDLVFFQKRNSRYRIYRPTGRVDYLFTPQEEIQSYLPMTNDVISYDVYSSQWSAGIAAGGDAGIADIGNDDTPFLHRKHRCKTGAD